MPGTSTRNYECEYDISTPAATRLALETSNGTIRISGFTVNYTLDDAGHKRGNIGAGRATLTITTGNGDVTVRPR